MPIRILNSYVGVIQNTLILLISVGCKSRLSIGPSRFPQRYFCDQVMAPQPLYSLRGNPQPHFRSPSHVGITVTVTPTFGNGEMPVSRNRIYGF
jgi:hypothetical protein